MIVGQLEKLTGGDKKTRTQAVLYTLCGLVEACVYASLLPLLRAFFAGDLRATLPWLATALGFGAASAVLNYFVERRGYLIGCKVVLKKIQQRLGDHIVKLPLGWFTSRRAGQLSSLMERDLQMVMNLPSTFLRVLVLSVTVPVCIALLFLLVDWRIFLSFVVLAPLMLVGTKRMARAAGDGHRLEEESNAQLTSRVLEFVHAQPVLRASGAARVGWEALKADIARDREATLRTLSMAAKPMSSYLLTVYASFGLVLATSTALLATAQIDAVGYLFVLIMGLRFVDALMKLGSQGMSLRVCKNALDAVERVLAAKPLPEAASPREPQNSSIEFDRASFSYEGEHKVLDEVTLACPENTLTALVGPSGSGKTTLTRLVARFWDVDGGSVRVGGVDVREISMERLLGMVSLVFQDVYLFDGTIEENIRFGSPKASEEQLRHAARVARLDEVAARLEGGWGARVGEGGCRLSGGERQRVSIARALLKDAPIVLFDEATAALDAENEAAIVAAIHELAKERTVVVIAHRLSTIAAADQIVMLEAGRITQRGTHEELLAQEGRYRGFWKERTRALGWQLGASE